MNSTDVVYGPLNSTSDSNMHSVSVQLTGLAFSFPPIPEKFAVAVAL